MSSSAITAAYNQLASLSSSYFKLAAKPLVLVSIITLDSILLTGTRSSEFLIAKLHAGTSPFFFC